ncbi:MAG: hypothetical protein ACRBBW_20605 [Cellvibrionaceae bacterium]
MLSDRLLLAGAKPEPEFIGSSVTAGDYSPDIAAIPGVQAGDLLVFVGGNENSSSSYGITGFTDVERVQNAATALMQYKIATNSEPTLYAVADGQLGSRGTLVAFRNAGQYANSIGVMAGGLQTVTHSGTGLILVGICSDYNGRQAVTLDTENEILNYSALYEGSIGWTISKDTITVSPSNENFSNKRVGVIAAVFGEAPSSVFQEYSMTFYANANGSGRGSATTLARNHPYVVNYPSFDFTGYLIDDKTEASPATYNGYKIHYAGGYANTVQFIIEGNHPRTGFIESIALLGNGNESRIFVGTATHYYDAASNTTCWYADTSYNANQIALTAGSVGHLRIYEN